MAARIVRIQSSQDLPIYINPAAVTHITVDDHNTPTVHFVSGNAVTVSGDLNDLLDTLFPPEPASRRPG
jgi:hypothetical protein